MIHAVIFKDRDGEYTGFTVKGHAGYAREGQDIVCAAASMLVINTMNAIERFTEDSASVVSDDTEGKIAYQLKGKPSKEALLLLRTLALGLREMADDENYAEYIDLTFEEV